MYALPFKPAQTPGWEGRIFHLMGGRCVRRFSTRKLPPR